MSPEKSEFNFDLDSAISGLREGKGLTGQDGVLTPSIKRLTEVALEAKLDSHLGQEKAPNRKNGNTPKTVKSAAGSIELNTSRDHTGTFEPQLVKKHQTHLTDEIERKVLALCALGNSYQEIRGHIEALEQPAEATLHRYSESVRALDSPGLKLEPDAVLDDNPLPRKTG